MSLNVDTTGVVLTDRQEIHFRRLFRWLLKVAASADQKERIKGNIIIPIGAAGEIGQIKVESWQDIVKEASVPANNGAGGGA